MNTMVLPTQRQKRADMMGQLIATLIATGVKAEHLYMLLDVARFSLEQHGFSPPSPDFKEMPEKDAAELMQLISKRRAELVEATSLPETKLIQLQSLLDQLGDV